MAEYGVSFEEIKVTTADGWELPLYHLKPTEVDKERMSPVLFMHGFGESALVYAQYGEASNLPFQMMEEGMNVYMGSWRGTLASKYTGDAEDAGASTVNMGAKADYDFPALVDAVLDHN